MTTEYVDVLIIGAGLSGIGAAYHLQKNCPNKSYLILEGRETLGGTWDLFRYPGIRSDSDMFTLGYNFKPWTNPKAIADGDGHKIATWQWRHHHRTRHQPLAALEQSAEPLATSLLKLSLPALMQAGQILYLLPPIAVLAVMGLWRTAASRPESAQLLLWLIAMGPIVLFNIVYLFSNKSFPHWTMLGWMFALILTAQMIAGGTDRLQ